MGMGILEMRVLGFNSGGSKCGYEPGHPWDPGRGGGEIRCSAMVPAEPEIAGGAVEVGKGWRHRGVRHHRTGTIGASEHSAHRTVQHGAVP